VSDRGSEGEKALAKTRILVAEDDAVSREVIATRLTNWGYEPVVTKDGTEAMTILRSNDAPSLAILDWMMPGMDGLEICRRVREVQKVVYIILLTARSGKADVVEGLRAGADDYLIKPFDKAELHARLLVGLRVVGLQMALAERVKELEAAQSHIENLKLRIPI
jgi:DNA-binding response OmpR family regulator